MFSHHVTQLEAKRASKGADPAARAAGHGIGAGDDQGHGQCGAVAGGGTATGSLPVGP